MSIASSDLILTYPIFIPPNHKMRVGGQNSREVINSSDVNSVFMPGMIKDSTNFTDVNYYQYAKIFLFNKSHNNDAFDVKVYGYNINRNNIVKLALEKDRSGSANTDGEESTKNRKTEPNLFGSYNYTEVHSDAALAIGNSGTLSSRTAQGIWLKMAIDSSDVESALDTFRLGIKYRQESL